MTNHWNDLKNSDCFMVCGSNCAENHPVSFKWMEVAMNRKDDPATLIVVDPRFTRTAAVADIYAQNRPGTDIVLFGGMVNYALGGVDGEEKIQKEYVTNYTNATFIVDDGYSFDPSTGYFSGWDKDKLKYDQKSWTYKKGPDGQPLTDPTLADPRCVYQLSKEHFKRYTPEKVSAITGVDKDKFLEIAKAYCATGAPEKSGTLLYAMGLTQHTYGTQNIRTFALLQLLLGNTGMCGGGVNALRGESNVQGSTDMALLWHIIPAYLATPNSKKAPTLKAYNDARVESAGSSYWKNGPKFMNSLLKAFWGDFATPENDFGYEMFPKVADGKNYSHIACFEACEKGEVKGMMCWGQNHGVSGPNGNMELAAMEKLDWLVVAELWETEVAAFWKRPGVKSGDIDTEVFLLPAVCSTEKEGTISNSGRWIQWRYKAADGPGKARTDASIISMLTMKLMELYKADAEAPNAEAITELYWPYGEEPNIDDVLKELNGFTWDSNAKQGKLVANFTKLMDDGTTACGNWLFSGVYPEEGKNKAKAQEDNSDPSGLGLYSNWTFCWPVNRRIIYNRCSADPGGTPWNPDKDLVTWDGTQWVNNDVPDFAWKKDDKPVAPDVSAKNPYIMLNYGKAQVFAPGGLADGPFPEHYEPVETPFANEMNPAQVNPGIENWMKNLWTAPADKLATYGSADNGKYPIICTSYRVTEMWQAGQMTRNSPWLIEMQPEMFIEMSKDLARRKGISDGDWVKLKSIRGEVNAVAIVTDRIQVLDIVVDGETIKTDVVGIPWHYGYTGRCIGGPKGKSYSANQLTPHVGDANTMIPEYKAFLVDIEKA